MVRTIPRIDLMIAYSCNLSCAGCISLSDRAREGVAPLAEIKQWINHWSGLINPKVVTLFGGEPCLHPQLLEICQSLKQYWPDSIIRLITNGYLLDNFDSSVWFQFSPIEIQISVHRKDHESIINQAIKKILLHRNDWKISKTPDDSHKQLTWTSNGIKVYKSIFKDFIIPFKSINGDIEPWHSRPEKAHAICGAPNTPILYKGRLYKCPAVANAMDLSKKNWFEYRPCDSEHDLDHFIENIGRPEQVCGQCPELNQAIVIDHFDKNNVIVKQKISY